MAFMGTSCPVPSHGESEENEKLKGDSEHRTSNFQYRTSTGGGQPSAGGKPARKRGGGERVSSGATLGRGRRSGLGIEIRRIGRVSYTSCRGGENVAVFHCERGGKETGNCKFRPREQACRNFHLLFGRPHDRAGERASRYRLMRKGGFVLLLWRRGAARPMRLRG